MNERTRAALPCCDPAAPRFDTAATGVPRGASSRVNAGRRGWPVLRARLALRAAALGLIAAFLGAQGAPGQTNTPSRSPHRWLFVIQTTASMQPRAEAVRRLAAGLLLSGMNGQMRPGDSVGVWTYNDALHTGKFPLQQWTPDARKTIARRLFDFLNDQTFEKKDRCADVFQDIETVAQHSDLITAVVISDGFKRIHYTPFDEKINSFYSSWARVEEKSQMPLVTVLRAKGGHFTEYATDVSPWPLVLPPLPAEQELARIPEKAVVQPAPAPVAPLIISGRKPELPPETNLATTALAPADKPSPEAAPESTAPKPISSPTHPLAKSLPSTDSPQPVRAESARPLSARIPAPAAPEPLLNPRGMGTVALVSAGFAAGIIVMLLLRSRNAPRISLNPHSLSRNKQ